MMTVTSMPAARLRLLAESRVIDDIALYVDNLAGEFLNGENGWVGAGHWPPAGRLNRGQRIEKGEPAAGLADYILGPDGQKVLTRFGLDAPEK